MIEGLAISRQRLVAVAVALAMIVAIVLYSTATAQAARCTDFAGGWNNHGQHVIGNYVLGEDIGTDIGWPPTDVGQAIGGSGAAAPGAPGSEGHRAIGPGASFCPSPAQN